jgi:hypothetical protein
MSDRAIPERKRRKSGQERTADYRQNNPDQVKLSREKEKLDLLKKRLEDEQFHEEVKRKERERKRVYRAKKALEGNKENDDTNESPQSTSNQTPKSRQSLAGLLARRRTSKEKNETIDDLVDANKDLENENARMDISMRETDTENMKLKMENKKKDREILDLKNKLVENDLWLKSTFKYMTSSGKREFKTAHNLATSRPVLKFISPRDILSKAFFLVCFFNI